MLLPSTGSYPPNVTTSTKPLPSSGSLLLLCQGGNTKPGVKRGFGMLVTPHGRLTRHIRAPKHHRKARASTGKLGGIGRGKRAGGKTRLKQPSTFHWKSLIHAPITRRFTCGTMSEALACHSIRHRNVTTRPRLPNIPVLSHSCDGFAHAAHAVPRYWVEYARISGCTMRQNALSCRGWIEWRARAQPL